MTSSLVSSDTTHTTKRAYREGSKVAESGRLILARINQRPINLVRTLACAPVHPTIAHNQPESKEHGANGKRTMTDDGRDEQCQREQRNPDGQEHDAINPKFPILHSLDQETSTEGDLGGSHPLGDPEMVDPFLPLDVG